MIKLLNQLKCVQAEEALTNAVQSRNKCLDL